MGLNESIWIILDLLSHLYHIYLMQIPGKMCQKLVLVFSLCKFIIFTPIPPFSDHILLDCDWTFVNILMIHEVHSPNLQACLKCLIILCFYQSICTLLLQDLDSQKYLSRSLKLDHWCKQVCLKILKWIQKECLRLL